MCFSLFVELSWPKMGSNALPSIAHVWREWWVAIAEIILDATVRLDKVLFSPVAPYIFDLYKRGGQTSINHAVPINARECRAADQELTLLVATSTEDSHQTRARSKPLGSKHVINSATPEIDGLIASHWKFLRGYYTVISRPT